MRVVKLFVAASAVVVLVSGLSAQADPTVGTWKLNLAKTKYNAGQAPKSSTLVITAAGQGVKLASDTVLADGTPRKISYTATYDGKDAAVTGTPDYDTISLKKTATGMDGSRKKAGKVVQTFSRVVSADGKTMTVTSTGTGAAGKVDNVQVYDKQ
jgi:LysM repeat protein